MNSFVHPKENMYFYIMLVLSIIMYLFMVISIVGILYIIIGVAIAFMIHGIFIGYLKGNCIKVTQNQFPEVYQAVARLSGQISLYPAPEVYILQSGGMLNAFATRFLGRDFVVLYSDILEMAYQKGESALNFIIGHELGHLKRNHLSKMWLLYPSMLIPFLGSAYSRACEFTCDRLGAYLSPEGAEGGLLVLAAGKKLYQSVNISDYIIQADINRGFWVWFSEVLSSHPNLPERLKAIRSISG